MCLVHAAGVHARPLEDGRAPALLADFQSAPITPLPLVLKMVYAHLPHQLPQ